MDWKQAWHFLFELGASWGIKLLGSIVVLLVGLKLIKWVKKWIKSTHKLIKIDDSVRSFLVSFTGFALYTVLFITVAMMLGIPATSFLAAIASCGVAIGLALQGALSNFAGGLMILIFKPFKVGDYITTAETAGTVIAITVVYTVLKTPDNKVITVPNGTLTNTVVENYSAVEKRRVDLNFNTSYSCDVDKVKELLLRVISSHPQVLNDPAPFARLSEHGQSALVFTVRVWCKTGDYWNVRFDLVEDVKKAFDASGIVIPYPQMDVHINKY